MWRCLRRGVSDHDQTGKNTQSLGQSIHHRPKPDFGRLAKVVVLEFRLGAHFLQLSRRKWGKDALESLQLGQCSLTLGSLRGGGAASRLSRTWGCYKTAAAYFDYSEAKR